MDPDICDASAALIGASFIIVISIYMLFELYYVYNRLLASKNSVMEGGYANVRSSEQE